MFADNVGRAQVLAGKFISVEKRCARSFSAKQRKEKEGACVFIYARLGRECQISTNTSSALLLAKCQGELTGTGQPGYCPQKDDPQICHYVILLNSRHVPSKCRAHDDSALAVWDNECSHSSSGPKSPISAEGKPLCTLLHFCLLAWMFNISTQT